MKIDEEPVFSKSFDYFTPIEIESAQDSRIDGYVRPIAPINNAGPFEFLLSPISDSFLNMQNLYMYMKCKIVDASGNDVAAHVLPTKDVNTGITPAADPLPFTIINGLGLTFFRSLEISIDGNVIIEASQSHAMYKAYMETVLSYECGDTNTHLTTALFTNQNAEESLLSAATDKTEGYAIRYDRVKESKEFEFCSPIANDFLRSNQHLAPHKTIKLIFHRVPDDFLIISDGTQYKLQIMDMRLYYTRIFLKQDISRAISLKKQNYHFSRTQMSTYSFPGGISDKSIVLFDNGILPKSIIYGFVKAKAYNGHFSEDPFIFQNAKIRSTNLKISGTTIPSTPFYPDWENNLYMREYMNLFMNTGNYRIDRSLMISFQHFKKSLTLWSYDLSADYCNGQHLHASQLGNCLADFSFSEPVESEGYTLIVYLLFDQRLTTEPQDNLYTIKTL